MQNEEIELLKRKCQAWKVTGRKGQNLRRKLGMTSSSTSSLQQDEENLAMLLQERATRRQAQLKRAAKSRVKKKMMEDVAAGKRGVFYLKKRDRKQLELEAKFEELKEKGGENAVDDYLQKKRKRNKVKDSGFMPKLP